MMRALKDTYGEPKQQGTKVDTLYLQVDLEAETLQSKIQIQPSYCSLGILNLTLLTMVWG